MKQFLFIVLLFALFSNLLIPIAHAADAAAAGPTLFERAQELFDTIKGNIDVFLSIAFLLLTAAELAVKAFPTKDPQGFTARAGSLIDKALSFIPSRVKRLPDDSGPSK